MDSISHIFEFHIQIIHRNLYLLGGPFSNGLLSNRACNCFCSVWSNLRPNLVVEYFSNWLGVVISCILTIIDTFDRPRNWAMKNVTSLPYQRYLLLDWARNVTNLPLFEDLTVIIISIGWTFYFVIWIHVVFLLRPLRINRRSLKYSIILSVLHFIAKVPTLLLWSDFWRPLSRSLRIWLLIITSELSETTCTLKGV